MHSTRQQQAIDGIVVRSSTQQSEVRSDQRQQDTSIVLYAAATARRYLPWLLTASRLWYWTGSAETINGYFRQLYYLFVHQSGFSQVFPLFASRLWRGSIGFTKKFIKNLFLGCLFSFIFQSTKKDVELTFSFGLLSVMIVAPGSRLRILTASVVAKALCLIGQLSA